MPFVRLLLPVGAALPAGGPDPSGLHALLHEAFSVPPHVLRIMVLEVTDCQNLPTSGAN